LVTGTPDSARRWTIREHLAGNCDTARMGIHDVKEAAVAEVEGVGLAQALESIRADLLSARASGEDADVRLPVQSVTVVLQVVATVDFEGKAGFKVPVVNVELGASGGRSWEKTSTITVVLGPPVDRSGVPVKVAATASQTKG
jgi:hypothetical protein